MAKLQHRIALGVGIIVGVGIITILFEAVKIGRFASMAGESPASTYISIGIAIVAMIAIATSAMLYLIKIINTHVNNLSEYAKELGEGKTNFEIKAPYEDEFVGIYNGLNGILTNDKECANVAEAISHGDLTVKCQAKNSEDIMAMSLSNLLKNNNRVLSGIKESSYQLTTGAEQVAAASQSLAQGSTEQASAIEEVTVSMKDIEEMTKANASDASKANDIVTETKRAAELGNTRMEEMKAAMEEINSSSEKISKIIKVIDDISFQTNILALNAAVEAARAGTHGKGFAVVAEQIRELAGKSADAAAETADMIDDSINKVHNGTKLATETAKALNEIVDDVEQVADITGSIAKASNEQAAAVAQIDQAINQVSLVVQNNSATSEECAAAAEQLSGQALALRQMIGKYKLSGDSSSYEQEMNYTSRKDRTDYRSTSKIDIKLDDSEEDPESIISLDGGYGKY